MKISSIGLLTILISLQVCVCIHAQTPTSSKNSVMEQVPRDAMTTLVGSNYTSVQSKISYVDGLGRPIQSVIYRGSADGQKDILATTPQYDAFGRQFKNIIPVASINGNGGFYAKADSLAKIFYQDQNPSSEVNAYDNSPLNRVLKSYGVGQAWRTAQKYVEMKYEIEGNGIRLYAVNSANDGAVNLGAYPASSLIKKVMVNEREKQTWEITDLAGKTIVRAVQDETGYMVSQYIYDDMERLRYVCPPKSFDLLPNGFLESDPNFTNGIFAYKYDNRSRIIAKHVPNAGWTYIIYDKRDLPVMTQDSKDRENNRYQFTKYDTWGRPILTGFINNMGTNLTARQTIQDSFESNTIQYPFEKRAETGDVLLHYTNDQSFPTNVKPIEANTLTATYYDDYNNWITTNITFKTDSAFHTPYGNANGVMTGMQYRNLGNNGWLYSANFYDDKRRTIQQNMTNHLGETDRMDTEYRFNGEVKTQRAIYKRPSQPTITTKTRYRYDHQSRRIALHYSINGDSLKLGGYEYDPIGRLSKKAILPPNDISSKQTGLWTQASTWLIGDIPKMNDQVTINQGHTVTIPPNGVAFAGKLDDYGLLIMNNTSTLNMGKPRTIPLQIMDYSYHIRGGLRGINLGANGNVALANGDLFSFKLSYEDDGTYLDGNIRKQEWMSSVDNLTRSYTYSYDNSNRILGAVYGGGKAGENYSLENMSYDKNGNILSLSRNGLRSNNTYGVVDNLAYSYLTNSNQIMAVTDNSGEVASFKDVTGVTDYTYSADGNLNSDANKNITSIEYNHLKLPSKITFLGGQTIEKQYDALGKKLREKAKDGTITDFDGNVLYRNNIVYQIAHEEGRYANGQHEYDVKDHLGNLRISYRDSSGIAKIVQKQDYDPWGAELIGISYLKSNIKQNDFKYNGKQNDIQTGFNDLGWRQQDPILGRLWSVDRFSEKYFELSGYQFAANNPIRFIDVNGDSLMLFKNGIYVSTVDNGLKKMTGFNQESTVDKDGNETFTGGQFFVFNDIELDKKKLVSEAMILNFVSEKDVKDIISQSGVEDQNVFSRWTYASVQSNGGNNRGEGKMDLKGQVPYSTLSIINGVGYNQADAGNYLWGYAMRRMGYANISAKIASNLNAWWSAKESNNQGSTDSNYFVRMFKNRSWGGDSESDQRAIKRGISDAGGYWENKKNSIKKLWE